ncbi:hypothetical protein P692DRAFT_20471993 [Suillus brevipes Sb2]|nr:hypothetical protein P692DRAFT_20471993 [Suillus brevipes Sb2]
MTSRTVQPTILLTLQLLFQRFSPQGCLNERRLSNKQIYTSVTDHPLCLDVTTTLPRLKNLDSLLLPYLNFAIFRYFARPSLVVPDAVSHRVGHIARHHKPQIQRNNPKSKLTGIIHVMKQ